MADGTRFAGSLFDSSGTAISGATVNLYDANTTTPNRANTTTDANGDWEIDHGTRGEFDIEIVNGTTTRRLIHDTELQVKSIWAWNADANEYAFGVTRTEDVASVEVAYFEGDRATPGDGDEAYIDFRMSDDGGNQENVARILFYQNDVNPSADGRWRLQAAVAGTLTDAIDVNVSAGGTGTITVANFDLILNDNVNAAFGTGSDATIDWNGTNWIFDYDAQNAGNDWIVQENGTERWRTNTSGQVIVGDGTKTSMDVQTGPGFLIDATNSTVADEIFTVADTAISHGGLTGLFGTDALFTAFQRNATDGGIQIHGIQSNDNASGTGDAAMLLEADTEKAFDTTKSTSGRAVAEIHGIAIDGAGARANSTADGNVFGVRTQRGGGGTTLLLLDEDGDLWLDGSTVIMPNLQSAAAETNVSYNATSDEFQQDSSSRRFKTNIADYELGTDILRQLRPRSFDWRRDVEGFKPPEQAHIMHDHNLIAEEVWEIAPHLVNLDHDGIPHDLRQGMFVAPLLAGWQEHDGRIESLEDDDELFRRIEEYVNSKPEAKARLKALVED